MCIFETNMTTAHLVFCEEVNIIVLFQGFCHPVNEDLREPLVRLQPGRVEAQAEWGSI